MIRQTQAGGSMDYRVISADNHVLEPPNTFVDRVPARLKERAPRVVRGSDGGDGWSFDGKPPRSTFSAPEQLNAGGLTWDRVRPGNYDGAAHLKDMALDGIDAAVIFPMISRFTYEWDDRELALACVRAYNDWLLEDFCSVDPRRLIPMAVLPTDDGEHEMLSEAERVVAKGARGFFLPYYPARPLYDPYYDPLWKLASESGTVASLHHMFGGKRPGRPPVAGVDAMSLQASSTVQSYFAAIGPLTDMMFTGVFQRFPALKFMHAEVNMGWAGYWMQQMHLTIERQFMKGSNWYPNLATRTPEEYIGQNVFFTALDDYVGFDLAGRDPRLANATMYSIDYEHSITLWPKSGEFIARLTAGLDDATKYKLLAGNAVRIFNLQ
jgi:predicted TIM-barrel fold metal-dependent hydrolase